jgi:hypothetical protein
MKAFKDLESLAERPAGYDGQCNGKPDGDELQRQLTDETVAEAYKVPWEAYGHLKDGTELFNNSVWGMGDGRMTVSQTGIPEIGKGKK